MTPIQVNGKTAGVVEGQVFYAEARFSDFTLLRFPALMVVFDFAALQAASSAGAHYVEVHDLEHDHYYRAPLCDIFAFGWKIGCGDVRKHMMPMEKMARWTRQDYLAERVRTGGDAAAEASMRQLELFDANAFGEG